MKNLEAVIFDWAGTTVDYGCFAPVQAFVEAFKEFGITPTIEEVREPMGMLKHDHIETMLKMPRIREEWKKIYGNDWTDKDVDAVYEKSESGILKILNQFADPKPYVLETIEELRGMGLKIGSSTGYTDEMMDIVVPKAEENGYKPDCWFSADAVGGYGRPYPYMIFKNMQELNLSSVEAVIKVGDTVSDIKEGKNAGVISIGIVEGSSVMALSKEDFDALSKEEQETKRQETRKVLKEAGADYVIDDIRGLLEIIKN
jgi:phosphonoacetaldehyde hydrolase